MSPKDHRRSAFSSISMFAFSTVVQSGEKRVIQRGVPPRSFAIRLMRLRVRLAGQRHSHADIPVRAHVSARVVFSPQQPSPALEFLFLFLFRRLRGCRVVPTSRSPAFCTAAFATGLAFFAAFPQPPTFLLSVSGGKPQADGEIGFKLRLGKGLRIELKLRSAASNISVISHRTHRACRLELPLLDLLC